MKKLLDGIIEFRRKLTPSQRQEFANLALDQAPDCLFIACSDSRVVPNLFASTNPGDLFVIRNVGNLIPACGARGFAGDGQSIGAAIEFSLQELGVKEIVVCGHSECGAMQALLAEKRLPESPHLESWLAHGKPSLQKFKSGLKIDPQLRPQNQLSQVNVLQQLEHLRSYPLVREGLHQRKLRVHGWWFDIASAEVYAIDETLKRVDLIDEEHVRRMLPNPSRSG